MYIVNATNALQHRGPDYVGFAVLGPTLLGHTRLAIVDPDSGAQPIVRTHAASRGNAAAQGEAAPAVWRSGVTVNGEIYNFQTLRAQLEDRVGFRSDCDCEVVGPAIETWGVAEACRRFDGVFAFVWADDRGNFACARDALGVNPLYYAVRTTGDGEDREYWFASEIKAFEHLTGAPTPCLFPPGHYMDQTTNGVPVPYYDYEQWTAPSTHDMDEAVLADLLRNAVRKRMMADREIGVFLSGGLDSSLVAGLVVAETRRQQSDSGGGGCARVKSFSIGLQDSPDLAHARRVAEHLGTEHHEVTFTIEEGLAVLPQVVRAVETIDTTSIRASTPMWLLSRYIKTHTNVRVVYSGEGADEALCGYLHFHNAPTPHDGRMESVRRVRELHMYDNQRANKSTAAHGLEVRVPFLDLELIRYVMTVHPEGKLPRHGVEKHALRQAFAGTALIPDEVLWRQKEQFSDGVGHAWIDALKRNGEEANGVDHPQVDIRMLFERAPTCGEQRVIMQYFATQFSPDVCARVGRETGTWAPEWNGNDHDPSGRAIAVHRQTWAEGGAAARNTSE